MTVLTILAKRFGAMLLVIAIAIHFAACGDDLNLSFRRPSEPFEATLFDLFGGPLDRASALDVVAGSGRLGIPRAVRVDQGGAVQWDVAFAVMDGQPVWLPRGFFAGFEPSSGIVALERGFEEIIRVPGDRSLYEMEDPIPLSEGTTYAIRSRNSPGLSLPCRIFAKLEVEELELDPARIRVRFLWNPNCDDRLVTPEAS